MALLKNVGKGILYIIGLPFFLIVLAGASLLGVFLLVFMFFKSIILFFTGRSLDDDLPEDIKVKEIKGVYNHSSDESISEEVVEDIPSNSNDSSTTTTTSIEEAVFGHPIYGAPSQDEIVEEPVEETPIVQDPQVPEEPNPLNGASNNVIDSEIGQYVPRNGGSRFIDDEEEDDDSGVTIISGDDDD